MAPGRAGVKPERVPAVDAAETDSFFVVVFFFPSSFLDYLDCRRSGSHFHGPFTFRDPDDVFREFFGENPFFGRCG